MAKILMITNDDGDDQVEERACCDSNVCVLLSLACCTADLCICCCGLIVAV